MNHTLRILVNNHAGVMSHVSGLFTRRAYNIDSIAVGVTQDPEISCMTIVIRGDEQNITQVKNQLKKLPDVLEITDVSYPGSIHRELLLVIVEAKDEHRQEVISICDVFQAKIIDMTSTEVMAEYSGNSREVNAFLRMMNKFGIKQISRTGQIALTCPSTLE
ncbi:MAG: acetolactate synthase small subunit [Leptospiraceae bacterium]|nr:acetolactate synthase small subunit [Leptospiraceae bacterium]MCP5500724.1 acetolactate synthase small subunit [Leptospiraceae bacterium]